MPTFPPLWSSSSNPMYVSLYETYLKMRESYTFYYAPQMENYLDLETRFEKSVPAEADGRPRPISGGRRYGGGIGLGHAGQLQAGLWYISGGKQMRPIREAIQKKRAAGPSMGLRLLPYWLHHALLLMVGDFGLR